MDYEQVKDEITNLKEFTISVNKLVIGLPCIAKIVVEVIGSCEVRSQWWQRDA